MKNIASIVILLFSACFGVRADEVTLDNLAESLRQLESSGSTQKCSELLDSSHSKNSAQLFYSAAVCAHEKRNSDASFFMLAGQVRSTADMNLYEPASQKDQETVGTLYGLIFYQFGGAGDESIYRDPVQYATLMEQLDQWIPSRPESYSPGWRFKRAPREDAYQKAVVAAKQHRAVQLTNYSKLIRDELYYSASQELAEIQRRNPGGIVSGTDDGKRTESLLMLMRQREAELGGD